MKICICIITLLLVSLSLSYSQQLAENINLPLKYLKECSYDSALFYAEETSANLRGTTGEGTSEFADALNYLATAHFYLGNFMKAKYYINKEIGIREALGETNSPRYILSLVNASVIYRKSGSYDEALELIKKADKKMIRINNASSSEYADILSATGNVYTDMGSSVNDMVFLGYADDYYLRAEKIYQNSGTKSLPKLIVNQSNQASYFNNTGNSPSAENLFQQVIMLCENSYGQDSPIYANALNNLAVFYYNGGFYKQAENYFVKAIDIYKKSPVARSIQAGICINNFGALYHDMGNYNIAEKLLSEAQGIFEQNKQLQNPSYAVLLNNQAMVILSREYFASADSKSRGKLLKCGQTLMLADTIFKANVKLPQPEGFTIMNNLSLCYKMTGDSKKSLQIMTDMAFQSNMSMRPITMVTKMSLVAQVPVFENEDKQGNLDPIMIPIKAKMVDNMFDEEGLKQNSMNQTASSRFLINLIIGKGEKVKKVLGPYHPAYALLLKAFIPLYNSIGSVGMEEDLTLEYMNIISHNTLQDFTFLSESEKEMYFLTRQPDYDAFIAYTLNRKESKPEITCNAYNFIIQNKGFMLKSSTAMRQAILSSNDPEMLKRYDDWLILQKEISSLYATPVEMRKQDVKVVEVRANLLEKELVKASQTFGDYRKGNLTTWMDVRNNLKPKEAAVEFTHFPIKEKDLGNVVYYCALIIKSDSPYPEMVKLFEEKELSSIIGNSQENNIEYINRVYGTRNKPDSSLYKLIWQPLESYLNGVNKVYLSPSGLLYKISFAAINSGKNVLLCDKYQIQVKNSTGNTINQDVMPSGNDLSALVFGGIKYSEDNSGSQVWNYLSGTKNEGDAVSEILRSEKAQVQYLTDNLATESYLKHNAQKYNLLHVATHGFFFPDPNETRIEEKDAPVEYGAVAFRGAMRGFGVNSFVNNQNPLMRSGLVFAGANDVWNKTEMEKEDDGVLTAQEVTQIDMRKNLLVVLSACETGLGDIKGNEGVYGLQRSFKMAGVKYILMSLWQVPDKETVEFMETFYSKLLIVKDIRQAFSETQMDMRRKYDPYYWAAFGLIE